MKKFTNLILKAGISSAGKATQVNTQQAPFIQPSNNCASCNNPHYHHKKQPEYREFPPSTAQNIASCELHDHHEFPNVKALEYCNTCQIGMCYICMSKHVDEHHTVDWGFDIFNALEPSRNEANDKFNAGYRTLFDWDTARCPCGAKLVGKKSSSICAACGTATCSAECHDKYVQSQGRCLFIRNFVQNSDTAGIQGLRNIHWINSYAMYRDNHQEFTPCAKSTHNFMKVMLGPTKNTIWLQRGFRHYGQPMLETIDGFKEIIDDDNDSHFQNHNDRLCNCECSHCEEISPHPVKNCFYKCKERLTLDEKTMRELGFYSDCDCQCTDCIRMPEHKRMACYDFCQSSPFCK